MVLAKYWHTHWDREWYEDDVYYQHRWVQVLTEVLTALNRGEIEAFLLDGQTIVLEDALTLAPWLEPLLNEAFAKQQLHCGPWYVMPDTVLVSTESLLRNLTLGIQQAKRWGCVQFTGYLPDSFGHPNAIPAVLNAVGIRHALLWRGRAIAPKQTPWFQWQATPAEHSPAVLTYQLAEGYFQMMLHDKEAPDATWQADTLQTVAEMIAHPHPCTDEAMGLFPLGGDHLGLPPLATRQAHQALLEQWPTQWPHAFMESLTATLPSDTLATRIGELRDWGRHPRVGQPSPEGDAVAPALLAGTLVARPWLKVAIAHAEHRLTHTTEPLLAMAWQQLTLLQQRLVHQQSFEAWRTLLLNHPHDSICGCSTDEVHRSNEERFARVASLAKQLESTALSVLMPYRRAGLQLVNPNPEALTLQGSLPLTLQLPSPEAEAWLNAHAPYLHVLNEAPALQHGWQHCLHDVPLSHLHQQEVSVLLHLPEPLTLPAYSTWHGDDWLALPTHPPTPAWLHVSPPWQLKLTFEGLCIEPQGVTNQQLGVVSTFASKVMPFGFISEEDAGDSYNPAPVLGTLEEYYLFEFTQSVAHPLRSVWECVWISPDMKHRIHQTFESRVGEPLLRMTVRFQCRPTHQLSMAFQPKGLEAIDTLAEASPLTVTAWTHLGWEERQHSHGDDRYQGYPLAEQFVPVAEDADEETAPARFSDEWHYEEGTHQGQLWLHHQAVALAGCYSYQPYHGGVALPLFRGFDAISGGVLPSRSHPAGPPVLTPEGQGLLGSTPRDVVYTGWFQPHSPTPLAWQQAYQQALAKEELHGRYQHPELPFSTPAPNEPKQQTLLPAWQLPPEVGVWSHRVAFETMQPIDVVPPSCSSVALEALQVPPVQGEVAASYFIRLHNAHAHSVTLSIPEAVAGWGLATGNDERLPADTSASRQIVIRGFDFVSLWYTIH
ncbi:MAG: hypothetical protein ACKO34_03340 [Vampirovibrionales bacterium]